MPADRTPARRGGRRSDAPLVTMPALLEALNGMRAELSLTNRRLELFETTLNTLAGRNLVPLDAELVGVWNALGWLIVPREEYRSLLHLANGTAGHEPGTLAVLQALVRSGDTVVDVGAHIGLLSLPLARLVGPTGLLISIEPNGRSAECLRRTLLCNGMASHSRVVQAAASDEDALTDLFLGANSMLCSLISESDNQPSITVKSVRLDNILPTNRKIDLIKIDAEGYETKVVAGLEKTIAANPEIVVIAEFGPSHLERYGMTPKDWFAAFFAQGLNAFMRIDESERRCIRSTIRDVENVYSVNLVFHVDGNPKLDRVWPEIRANGS